MVSHSPEQHRVIGEYGGRFLWPEGAGRELGTKG